MTKTIHTDGQRKLTALLIAARLEAGLSQAALAERLHCHQSMIARIESGERRIDVIEFIMITRAIGTRMDKIMAEVAEVVSEDGRL